MNNFNNDEWLSFIKDCENQVEQDNNMGLINSVFLRNPEICPNPQYCLIAMEPLDSDLNELKRKIGLGYRNFLEGYEELILLYCAYNYLGNKEDFNFYITDLSKGSMTSADADAEKREDRYARWQDIFKKEMNLLGNPKLIAISKRVYNFMHGKMSIDYIQHYSNNKGSADARERDYNYINSKFAGLLDSYCADFDEREFKKWALEKFMKHLKYERIYVVEQVLSKGLTESKRKLFALYRHNFESITENGRVTRGEHEESVKEDRRFATKGKKNHKEELIKAAEKTLDRFKKVARDRYEIDIDKSREACIYILRNRENIGCVKNSDPVFEYHNSHPLGRKTRIRLENLTDENIEDAIFSTP